MRNAIYGAGSLGTILGAYITRRGGRIDLINRNVKHVEALQQQGAHVAGTVDFVQPVTAYTPDRMTGLYDIIFLLTKQQENAKVVTFLKDYLARACVNLPVRRTVLLFRWAAWPGNPTSTWNRCDSCWK